MRIGDVPELDIEFIDSTIAQVGLGEPATTIVASAIGNAYLCRGRDPVASFADPAGGRARGGCRSELNPRSGACGRASFAEIHILARTE